MFQTTNQINNGSPNPLKSPLKLHYSHKITIKSPLNHHISPYITIIPLIAMIFFAELLPACRSALPLASLPSQAATSRRQQKRWRPTEGWNPQDFHRNRWINMGISMVLIWEYLWLMVINMGIFPCIFPLLTMI